MYVYLDMWSGNVSINDVSKMLLVGLPRKQNGRPIGYITLLSVTALLKWGIHRL